METFIPASRISRIVLRHPFDSRNKTSRNGLARKVVCGHIEGVSPWACPTSVNRFDFTTRRRIKSRFSSEHGALVPAAWSSACCNHRQNDGQGAESVEQIDAKLLGHQ